MIELDYLTYGEAVLNTRRRKKLTQRDMADRVGCSASYISNIEHGTARPSYRLILELCAALNIDEPMVLAIEQGEL